MKYKKAEEIGKGCGLSHPAEFVNNIIIHSTSLFAYEDITEEIDELKKDSTLEFCKTCRLALKDGKCYTSKNIGSPCDVKQKEV